MRHDEPLAPAGYRFPLPVNNNPRPAEPNEPDTAAAVVPFGLRFFRHVGPVCEADARPPHRYDHRRQLAVTDDAAAAPVITVPYLDAEPTTTGYSDGKRPRGEEFRIDYMIDAASDMPSAEGGAGGGGGR